jgi:CheY-like chemotaxis protein
MSETIDILVVDDYAASRYALARMLRRHGYETREVSTGEGMWAALRERLPDLLILDVNLPDASGFDLCRQLKDDPVHGVLPVIIVSASYIALDRRERLEAAGADAFLEQPLLAERLAEVVRDLVRRAPATG